MGANRVVRDVLGFCRLPTVRRHLQQHLVVPRRPRAPESHPLHQGTGTFRTGNLADRSQDPRLTVCRQHHDVPLRPQAREQADDGVGFLSVIRRRIQRLFTRLRPSIHHVVGSIQLEVLLERKPLQQRVHACCPKKENAAAA